VLINVEDKKTKKYRCL